MGSKSALGRIPDGNWDWERYTLASDYVFCEVMMREDLCRQLIELALQIPVARIELLDRQKDVRPGPETPGVRMDVYAGDGSGRVFDVEMQRRDEINLPRRARYYQSVNAFAMAQQARSLAVAQNRTFSWRERYASLRESYVIFICMFDPFDRGWKRYVFRNLCVGDPTLALGDGTTTVFLNAAWTHPGADDGTGEFAHQLDELLAYLHGEYDGDDEYIRALDDEVHHVCRRTEWRRDTMYFEELLELERDAARAEGKAEGRAKGEAEGRAEGRAEGERETLLRSIANLMDSMSLTAEQAMDAIRVPQEERARYAELLLSEG